MKTSIWISAVLALLLIGCTTASGVTPVHPEIGNPNRPSVVKSLQPSFEWKALPGAEAYDLIVYECIKTESFWQGTSRTVGREVYYREGLTGTRHRIEQDLKPDMEYYWSVRTRSGGRVSEWSVYDYTVFLGTGMYQATNALFIFKTPAS